MARGGSSQASRARVNCVAPTKYKLVFLGDQGVGKTSIITRFMYNNFDESYQATIGIDFLSKTIYVNEHQSVRLQLWDTAGQERFRALIPSYIRDSAAAIVVFDITNVNSFETTKEWINDVLSQRGDEVVLALVGNKCDLKEERAVTFEQATALAEEYGLMYMETSAKTGVQVKKFFKELALKLPGMDAVPQQSAAAVDIRAGGNADANGSSKGTNCCYY